jgi:hypothetical protein
MSDDTQDVHHNCGRQNGSEDKHPTVQFQTTGDLRASVSIQQLSPQALMKTERTRSLDPETIPSNISADVAAAERDFAHRLFQSARTLLS